MHSGPDGMCGLTSKTEVALQMARPWSKGDNTKLRRNGRDHG